MDNLISFINCIMGQYMPLIASASFAYVSINIRKLLKNKRANNKGTMLLLRIQLIEYHNQYVIRKENMPSYAYDNFVEMHDAYKSLGGNGLIDKMYKEMKNLNLKRKEDTNYGNI